MTLRGFTVRRRTLVLAVVGVPLALAALMLAAVSLSLGAKYGVAQASPRSISACMVPPIAALRGGRADCHINTVDRVMREQGVSAGLAMSVEHIERDSEFRTACHIMMHRMGRNHAGRTTIEKMLAEPPNRCLDGFLHGLLEARVAQAGDGAAVGLARVCERGERLELQRTCVHGLGHGLVRARSNDLPTALDDCAAVGDAAAGRTCASGAFMEDQIAAAGEDGASREGARASKDDPLAICRGVRSDMQATCRAWAVQLVPERDRLDFCADQPRSTHERCYMGMGAISVSAPRKLCGAEPACWRGAGFTFALEKTVAVPEQCGLATTPATREACVEGAAHLRSVRTPGTTDPARLCASAPTDLRAACLTGAARHDEPLDFF
jgi:hypothetical protein